MSILKNIVTFGRYGDLQKEKEAFTILSLEFESFQNDFFILNKNKFKLLQYLQKEREDVAKNLSLAKNLISKVKIITNDKKQIIKEDFVSYVENTNVEFQIGNVSIDFQGKLDNVSEKFIKSFDTSIKTLKNKNEFTKDDLKVQFANIAFDVIAKGIENVIAINKEVNENRKKIINATTSINNGMKTMTRQAPIIMVETEKIIEITKVLNKHNQVFSKKYQLIQNELNKKSKISNFINEIFNKKIIPNEAMQTNLHSLVQFSSQYNKTNKDLNI